MTEPHDVSRSEEPEATADAALFSRYAGTDPDRWRQLIGHPVVHRDPRHGPAVVEDIRWGTCCDHVPAYLQVRVRHAEHGVVVFRASSFCDHHRSVAISSELRQLLRICFEEPISETEKAVMLERHSRDLREERDRQRLLRADELKHRAAKRRGEERARH